MSALHPYSTEKNLTKGSISRKIPYKMKQTEKNEENLHLNKIQYGKNCASSSWILFPSGLESIFSVLSKYYTRYQYTLNTFEISYRCISFKFFATFKLKKTSPKSKEQN